MFLLGLRSRRQLRLESDHPTFVANLNRLAGQGVETAPHDDTIAYYMERLDPPELEAWPAELVGVLIRKKALDLWRLYGRFRIALDGTGQLVFRQPHCDHCLTRQTPEGKVLYFHYVLEAKLVTDHGLALSVATEFIRNEDPHADRQDCELKAFYRLAPKLKRYFPQLPIVLLGDGLYACGPVLSVCEQNGWEYIFTFKEGGLPQVFAEFTTLKSLCPKNRTEYRRGAVAQRFAWVNDLEHQGHRFGALDCQEVDPDGTPHTFAWITNLSVGCQSVITLANQGGRCRWKIENEGFNIQKNHGYELEHAYSQHETAAQNFYVLLQVAHLINQLMIKGLLRPFKQTYVSIRNYLRRLAEDWRNTLLDPRLFAEDLPAFQIRLDTS
jgi:hypothetical protein